MTTCTMPGCPRTPTTHNRSQQPTCAHHQPVVISGSWMGEGTHHAKEPDE